jgi:DNA-binding response OmpR family regulator
VSAPPRRPARVLVVDDDPVIRLILTVNLEAEGMEVVAAGSSRAGFDAALSMGPDLIVLDVMLPDCEGLTTLTRLKHDPRTRHVPAVILSARASDAERMEGWVAGADQYLTKPFDVDEVVAELKAVLAARSAWSPADRP